MPADLTWPPSIQAVDAVDPAFWKRYEEEHGWPAGTMRNVVDQIENHPPSDPLEQVETGDGPGGKSGNAPKHIVQYDADEMAAWNYFKSAYSEEQWSNLVSSYNAATPPPAAGDGATPQHGPGTDANGYPTAGTFDPNGVYIGADHPIFTKPEMGKWTGEGDPKSGVSVNAQALIWLADQLKVVTEGNGTPLDQAVKLLDAAHPLPGGFARAEVLRQKLVGGAGDQVGLQVETKYMLMAVRSTVFQVETGLRTLAKNYESTEELNDLTAANLSEVMDKTWQSGSTISESGKEVTTEGA